MRPRNSGRRQLGGVLTGTKLGLRGWVLIDVATVNLARWPARWHHWGATYSPPSMPLSA